METQWNKWDWILFPVQQTRIMEWFRLGETFKIIHFHFFLMEKQIYFFHSFSYLIVGGGFQNCSKPLYNFKILKDNSLALPW